jgi:hypothetical protein
LVSDIPAGDGEIANPFFTVYLQYVDDQGEDVAEEEDGDHTEQHHGQPQLSLLGPLTNAKHKKLSWEIIHQFGMCKIIMQIMLIKFPSQCPRRQSRILTRARYSV